MGFGAILIITALLTSSLIFGFYKVFLDKPVEAPQTVKVSTESEVSLDSSSTPSPKSSSKNSKSSSPIPSKKPSPTPKAIVGSVTPLQNNITASSQPGTSAISGSLYMSGSPPSGSSVVIAAGPDNGSNQSQVVISGLSPQTGSTFNWTGANLGTTYDMNAVLKQTIDGVITDIAQSPTYTLTAPTNNFLFTINVGYAMSAPTGQITVTCNTHYSNNTWSADVNFPLVSGALMYLIQIGTTSGGSDIANIAKNAQTQGVTFNDSVGYYAQYAVASVSNPTPYQYSDFSTPTRIQCP